MDDLYEILLRRTIVQEETSNQNNKCKDNHLHTITENGITTCISCGIEINYPDKNQTDVQQTTGNKDHYFFRKSNEKSIYNDIKHLNIPDNVKDKANEIFTEVCEKKTKRSTKRKSIIFGAVYNAYKLNNDPRTFESLRPMFDITRKDAANGLKFISEHISKDSPIRTIYITPEHIIKDFMTKFNATRTQIEDVVDIYRSVKSKSGILNRSKPQSVAAGVIYYYIIHNDKKIPIKEFTKKVNLSELTINKISKEVEKILDTE